MKAAKKTRKTTAPAKAQNEQAGDFLWELFDSMEIDEMKAKGENIEALRQVAARLEAAIKNHPDRLKIEALIRARKILDTAMRDPKIAGWPILKSFFEGLDFSFYKLSIVSDPGRLLSKLSQYDRARGGVLGSAAKAAGTDAIVDATMKKEKIGFKRGAAKLVAKAASIPISTAKTSMRRLQAAAEKKK